MTNLVATGVACGALAIVSFGGAVRNTFKLNSLREAWDRDVREPVPDHFKELIRKLD